MNLREFRELEETRHKIFLAKSKEFGYNLLLGIEYPSKHFEERNSFVNLSNSSVYYWSSCKNDEIIDVFDFENISQAFIKLSAYNTSYTNEGEE